MKNSNLDITSQFLHESALIQTTPSDFKLFLGPFQPVNDVQQALEANQILLYKPDFWDFLQPEKNSACFFGSTRVLDLKRDDLLALLKECNSAENKINWSDPDYKNFSRQYEWVQEKIKKGELLKGLPITYQRGEVHDTKNSATSGFAKDAVQTSFFVIGSLQCVLENSIGTTEKNNQLVEEYVYSYWKNGQGFIGQTPEVLLKSQAQSVETMALAGTWKKNGDVVDFEDSKTQQEHQFVVDDVKKQMQSFQLVEEKPTAVAELKHLYHLKTELKYKLLSSQSTLDVSQQLHPTAALGLYPRKMMQFQEFSALPLQGERKNFGAPFGFFSKEKSLLVVAIRNFYFSKMKNKNFSGADTGYLIEIFSGCGVTADSQIDLEWQELNAKRESVKKNMGLQTSELTV